MSKADIPIGKTGQIVSGKYKAWQVRIEDDAENTGGFLVVICRDFSMPGTEGYDSWVENKEALADYFEEAGWVVRWH